MKNIMGSWDTNGNFPTFLNPMVTYNAESFKITD